MSGIERGNAVEIAPFRKGSKRHYPSLAELDGCPGVVRALSGYGGELKALVDVRTEARGRGGQRYIPAKALKVLPAQGGR